MVANPDGPSYFEAFLLRDPHEPDLGPATAADTLARVLGTIRIQVAHAAELPTGVDWLLPLAGSPLLFGAALTVGTGTALELRRPNPLAAWYLLAFFGVLSLWPYDEGKRFLVPVLPLLLLFGWKGAARLLQLCRSSGRRRCGAWALAAAGVVLVVLALEVRALDAFSRQAAAASRVWVVVLVGAGLAIRGYGPAVWRPKGVWLAGIWLAFYLPANTVGSVAAAGDAVGGREAGIRTLVEWVGRETDRDAVVMTREEAAVVLYAERSVARLPVTADPGRLLAALDRADPDYLMVTEPHDHAYYRPTPPEVLATLESVLPAGSLRTVIETDGGRIVVIGRADGLRGPRGTGRDAPEVPPSAR